MHELINIDCPQFHFENIHLYCCDCMDLMVQLPDKVADLAMPDPPYGINVGNMAYTQENNRPVMQKNGQVLRVKTLGYKHGDWDKQAPDNRYFDDLIRISREQIIWGVDHFDYPFKSNGRIRWDKHTPDGVSFNRYEIAYCSLIEDEVLFDFLWAGMCQAKSTAEPNIQQGNKSLNEKRIHPCHKPTVLYKWLLKNYSDPSQKIIDTHLGSCSSVIAAYDFGVAEFVGAEIDLDYFNAGVNRFKIHAMQQKLF